MIQGHANGELGNKSRSWIGISSKNRTGVRSLELLHEVVTQDPEASGVVLTDEQSAEELYGPQTGP